VRGARAAVRPRAGDRRYWDTEVVAAAADGRIVASARITFVAVRGAARRLVTGLLAMNDPARLRSVFPAYVGRSAADASGTSGALASRRARGSPRRPPRRAPP
jgi:hypothetical protein